MSVKKRDCEWNEGKLKCCGRIVCELVGDDVSQSFHKVCKENRKSKLWKECSEFKHGSGLTFARIMVNEILEYEKKYKFSVNPKVEEVIKNIEKGEK